MCRWNAYSGQPILVAELRYRTEHGLVDQARQANRPTTCAPPCSSRTSA